jgi:DNA polymerase-3 subunit delta'
MLFKDILGQIHIKNHLTKSAEAGRIPHAQLFVGPEGSGTLPMAIAYAQYLLCGNMGGENAGENTVCNLKFEHFSHPDLHFVFPVATTDGIKSHPISDHFMGEWRQFLTESPYGSLFDWLRNLGIQNKQGLISVDEATDINKKLALKAYEGGYKVMIIWMADKMNGPSANKLLKLLEEPPAKTVFILITEHIGDLLQTIVSRCQVIDFMGLSESLISEALISRENCDPIQAKKIAHQSEGNYNKALHIFRKENDEFPFDEWFVEWVRSAFRAKGNAAAINDLIAWSEKIAATGRETQKQFLHYCIHFFRQALLLNYQAKELVFLETNVPKFELGKFAPFVNGANITDIYKELEEAIYHIERNGNSKIILTDLSIKLTRLIHKNV